MNKYVKIGLALLLAASVLFLCGTVVFFIEKENEKEKRISLESQLKETMDEKELIEKDLDELKTVNRDLEVRLSSAKEEARRIASELIIEKESKARFETRFIEEKEKREEMAVDLMKEKDERLGLMEKLSKAEESYRDIKKQFQILVEAKETLEYKIKGMLSKKGINLGKIEVKSRYNNEAQDDIQKKKEIAPVPAKKTIKTGDVLVVNKKFNFVVSNIGKLDGVDIGTEIDIYRGERFIAKTKIEKLYDSMSAATILPEYKDVRIREGDQARILF